MPGNNRTKRVVFFDGAGANQSTLTAGPYFVGDFETMSMSWSSSTAASSTLILTASNDDGLTAGTSIATYSTISTVGAQGLFTIDPGMRWLRAVRASADSTCVVILAARA